MSSWLIGVCMNASGATAINFGTVLIKFHNEVRKGTGPWKSVGLIFFVCGNIGTVSSFSFAAQSLLSAISAIQFVSNLIFAKMLLGDSISQRKLLGTAVLIGGTALIVLCSSKEELDLSADEFFDDYYGGDHRYILVAAITAIVLCLVAYFWYLTGALPFWFACILPGMEEKILFVVELPKNYRKPTIPIVYILLSAMIGSQSVVHGKALAVSIKSALARVEYGIWEVVDLRMLYVIGACIGCSVMWAIHLGRALKLFEGGFIIPLIQVIWTFCTMMSGGLTYREFEAMSGGQLAGFFSGTLVLFAGVSLLAPTAAERQLAITKEALQEATTDAQPEIVARTASYGSVTTAAEDEAVPIIPFMTGDSGPISAKDEAIIFRARQQRRANAFQTMLSRVVEEKTGTGTGADPVPAATIGCASDEPKPANNGAKVSDVVVNLEAAPEKQLADDAFVDGEGDVGVEAHAASPRQANISASSRAPPPHGNGASAEVNQL
mmetsp:Transcript_32872/g.85353  ORF Transcript_32872/g.85353 Transcript_32872/m.85353 type:complete len:494 (+) Transcript_32872:63-1544(+)